jgi:hypothetical protein
MALLNETPCSAISSLIEVGVGVNLALALLDDFRNTLKAYSGKFVDYATSYFENLFLPLLEVQTNKVSTNASDKAVTKAKRYVANLQATSSFFTNKTWFIVLKFMSLVIALALTLLLAVIPFVNASYVLTVNKVIVLWAICLFPFLMAFLQTISMVPVLIYFYLNGKYIEFINSALISHLRQLKDKPIP